MPKNTYNLGEANIKKQPQGRGGFGGTGTGEKPKNFKKSFFKLLDYSRVYLPAIIIAFLLAIAGTIFNIIGPDKLKDITDFITQGITGNIDLESIKSIGIILIILYGLGYIFNYAQAFIMATITQKITYKLRKDISEKINRIPLKYFDNQSFGNVLSRVTNDVDTIGQTLNQSLGGLVTSVTMFFGSIIMMYYTNAILGVAAQLSTIIGFFLMIFLIKKSQKYFFLQQEKLGKLNGHIEEMYAGHDIVKAYNGEKKAKQIFRETNQELYKHAWKSQFISGLMMPIMNFIGNFGYVVVCVLGATMAINGTISFGVIVAFMMYIRLFTRPLSQMAQTATSLQSATAASERVFEFLAEEELENENKKDKSINTVKGDIEFKNVHFGYTKDKTIINDFSAKIKSGQKIAIVGPTGAGKTTMVNLLMRFYEISSGEITIDGIPINEVTRKNIHDLFCMVLQDTWLFAGSIKDNIKYNKKDISDQKVIEACKAVGMHHFIKTLHDGYDTELTDNLNLSAGQKQLLTIARAIVEDAPLLILDEATSSVDTRTEILIQQAMDKLTVGRTSFIIAHRLSTIKDADMILVMNEGDIIEQGSHEELLAKNGFYAELYNSQFDNVS